MFLFAVYLIELGGDGRRLKQARRLYLKFFRNLKLVTVFVVSRFIKKLHLIDFVNIYINIYIYVSHPKDIS